MNLYATGSVALPGIPDGLGFAGSMPEYLAMCLESLKSWLASEARYPQQNSVGLDKHLVVLPITHNSNVVILQFNGWSVNLYADGTYIVEATDGG